MSQQTGCVFVCVWARNLWNHKAQGFQRLQTFRGVCFQSPYSFLYIHPLTLYPSISSLLQACSLTHHNAIRVEARGSQTRCLPCALTWSLHKDSTMAGRAAFLFSLRSSVRCVLWYDLHPSLVFHWRLVIEYTYENNVYPVRRLPRDGFENADPLRTKPFMWVEIHLVSADF